MPTLAALPPSLAPLADQAEAIAREPVTLPDGIDEIPAQQRAAWRRVLRGCVSGEGLEEWIIDPMMRGLAHAGLTDPEVLRFFKFQGVDELRHRDLFAAYLERHYGEVLTERPTLAHKLLYDGLFKAIIKQSERHPLRLLMPLLFYERAAGSLYMTRLIQCTAPSMPLMHQLLKTIRQDEARHVAGVGMTVRALIAKHPPSEREKAMLMRICKLIYWDMDRTAWWKPGLKGYMADLGLDTVAMGRDNAMILAEMRALLDGRDDRDD